MTSDFKELNLDQKRIKECLDEYCEINSIKQIDYRELKKQISYNIFRAEYEQDNLPVMVDFFFKDNGTTTISYQLGRAHDKGKALATFIKEKLVTDHRKNVTTVFKNIDQDTFDLLKVFISESSDECSEIASQEFSIEEKTELNHQHFKIVSLQYRDSVTLKYYETNKKIMLQCKPLYTYRRIIYFMSEYADLENFLEVSCQGEKAPELVDIAIDKNEITSQMSTLLKHSYESLGAVILQLLETSYILKNIDIDLPDYSCHVFPALRALEGVIKKMLFEKSISIQENDNSFRGIFYRDSNQRYVVNEDFKSKINNEKVCTALGNCYTYFNRQRHELFHMSELTDTSRIIEKKSSADTIVDTVIKLIDDSYRIINS